MHEMGAERPLSWIFLHLPVEISHFLITQSIPKLNTEDWLWYYRIGRVKCNSKVIIFFRSSGSSKVTKVWSSISFPQGRIKVVALRYNAFLPPHPSLLFRVHLHSRFGLSNTVSAAVSFFPGPLSQCSDLCPDVALAAREFGSFPKSTTSPRNLFFLATLNRFYG